MRLAIILILLPILFPIASIAQLKAVLFQENLDPPMNTILVKPRVNVIVPANTLILPDGLGPWYVVIDTTAIEPKFEKQVITKDTAFSFYGILPFVLETKNNDEYEVVITRKVVEPPPPVPDIIEDIDAVSTQIIYSGSPTTGRSTTHWTVAENQQQQPWFNKNLAYTFTLNATASITFTGKRIQIFAERKSSHGEMEITVGNFVDVKNLGSSNNGLDYVTGVPVFDMVVPFGTYTVTMKAKNAGGGKLPIVIDFIRVWR